jgi:hypothetical protein
VRIKLSRGYITVLGLHEEENSEIFYNHIQNRINKVSKSDMLLIMVDLNAQIANTEVRGHTGRHGETTCNRNGQKVM